MGSCVKWVVAISLFGCTLCQSRQPWQKHSWGRQLPDQVFPSDVGQDIASRLDLSTDPAPPVDASLQLAGRSVGRLGTSMLSEIYKERGSQLNNVVSPLSLWIVLVMLLEAAGGSSASELSQLLNSRDNSPALKAAYLALENAILGKGSLASDLIIKNFVVRDKDIGVNRVYNESLRMNFKAEIFAVNPMDAEFNAKKVNDWVAKATMQRIRGIIQAGDFENLGFLLGNAAYFKGRWKYPFNTDSTTLDQFKNESENILGNIPMMSSRLILKYAYSDRFDSQVIEIPYADDKISMIVFLPRRRVALGDIINRLKDVSLAEALPDLMLEEVDLYLPKFTVVTDLNLNGVLFNLGAKSMLNKGTAEFPALDKGGYLSRVLQKVELENSEEGTTASAVTSAQVSYKTSSVTFHANRPFIYFINDMKSRIVLFMGTISNPNSI